MTIFSIRGLVGAAVFLLTLTLTTGNAWATDGPQPVVTEQGDSLEANPIREFYSKNYAWNLPANFDQRLFAFVTRWHKVPYVYGGASKKGTDCSGFVMNAVDSLHSIKLPRVAGDQYAQCTPVKREDLQAGDLVFFTIGQRTWISHVGIYMGDGWFAHAQLYTGVVLSHLDMPYWNTWYYSAGRLKLPEADKMAAEMQ